MAVDLGPRQVSAFDALPMLLDVAGKGVVPLAAAGTLVPAIRKTSAAARQTVWLPAGLDGRRNRRALARRAAIVTLAAIAALAMPTACSKAPQKAQFKDATITLYMDLQSGKYVPDSTQATVLKVTDQKQLEALLAFFPEMDRGKESWRAAGWQAGVEIKFARPDGKTIRVSVSSNDDLTIWSEGHGDWPVNGDLKAFLLDLQKGQAATQPAAQMVLHIVSAAEWQRARQAGSYEPTSLGSGGFVHCSTPEQIVSVANANFRGKSGLVLLCINPKRLKAPVMYENLEGGTSLFPHIYGPVNLEAVVEVLDFALQQDGTFLLPAKLVAVPSASSGPAPEAARRPAAPRPATKPAQGPVQTDWSELREGVQMRLRAARKTWRADEIPALRWDARNVGTRKFLAVGDGQRLAQLEVDGVWHQWPTGLRSARLADMGAGAWLEDQLVTASPIWSQAKPEDLEWRMDGGGKIVLSGEESPPSLQFKPGTYTIRLAAVIQPSRVDTGDGFRVVSEPMDITIEALPAGQTASWPPGPKLAQAVKKALYRAEIPLTNTPRPGQPEMKDWIAGALAKAKQAATLAEKTPLHASASRLADAFVALQQAVDKDPAGAAKEFSAAWTAYRDLVSVLAGITSPTTQPATAPAPDRASTQPAEMVITPGVGVGSIALGMSREEVIKHLGKPVKIEGEGGYGLNYISSMGLSVLVSPRKGVVSISCWTSRVMYWLSALGMKDFRGATDKGIRMGAGRDEILRAYGKADSESGGAPLYMDYRSEGIKFILCSGKLAQIEVVEPDVFALVPAAAFSQPAATTQPATQPATQPGG